MPKKPKKQGEDGDTKGPAADHHDWIAEMAYFLAEKRGFAPGQELEDWYAAENIRAGES